MKTDPTRKLAIATLPFSTLYAPRPRRGLHLQGNLTENGTHGTSGIVRAKLPAIALSNPKKLAHRAFPLRFTNTPSLDFTAFTTTNIGLPLASWTALGSLPEISPSQYQFTDSANTHDAHRFYGARQP